jgi:hypothetical protein
VIGEVSMETDQNSMNPEFSISKSEIARRKRAYLTLSGYWLLGSVIFALIGSEEVGLIFHIILISFIIVVLFLIGFYTFKLLNMYVGTTVTLASTFLERTTRKSKDRLLYEDIEIIRLKRTTKGYIREIKILSKKIGTLYINGLDNFEEFKTQLLTKSDLLSKRKVCVKDFREPLEFDHPSFYTILGLIIGFLSEMFFTWLCNIKINSIHIFISGVSGFSVITGILLLFQRPISSRYGNKLASIDYLVSLLIVSFGLFIFFYNAGSY